MTLQDKLDAFKVEFETNQAPPAAVEAFHRSTQELIDAGVADRALGVGDSAPGFVLSDADGNEVSSSVLLGKGPLVLTFYRGFWCPYCNLELKALEAVRGEIESRGASLVAVSLQSPANSRKSQRQNALNFPILTDAGGALAEQFGLRWELQPYLVEVFKMFKVELPLIHQDERWTLPMPGRYVVDTDGTIAYAEVNPDYTRRPEPSDLLAVLDRLAAKRR